MVPRLFLLQPWLKLASGLTSDSMDEIFNSPPQLSGSPVKYMKQDNAGGRTSPLNLSPPTERTLSSSMSRLSLVESSSPRKNNITTAASPCTTVETDAALEDFFKEVSPLFETVQYMKEMPMVEEIQRKQEMQPKQQQELQQRRREREIAADLQCIKDCIDGATYWGFTKKIQTGMSGNDFRHFEKRI